MLPSLLRPKEENFAWVNYWHARANVMLQSLLLVLSDHLILHPLIICHDKLVLTIMELAEKTGLGRQRPHHQFLVFGI